MMKRIEAGINYLLERPVYLIIALIGILIVAVLSLIVSYATEFQRLSVVVGLYALSTISTIPDRYRPFISFRLGMMSDLLVSIAYGIPIGVLFTLINVATFVFVSKYYELDFVARTVILSPIFLAVLPNLLAATPANLAFVCLVCMVSLFVVTLPIAFILSGGNLPRILASGIFSIYWQYLLVTLYGVRILELLV